jgi:signal transduction histidine kinase
MPTDAAPTTPRRGWSEAWRLGLGVLAGLVGWVSLTSTQPQVGDAQLAWIVLADPLLGLVSLAVAHQRHRAPMTTTVVTSLVSLVSATATGGALLCLFSVGARRRLGPMAVAGIVNIVTGALSELVYYPEPLSSSVAMSLLAFTLFVIVVLAIGYAVGSRREVLTSLRLRAETAEREQATRLVAAQQAERTRIAREMHDVLAHRISLVAMHASALTYREDLPVPEQRAVARTIEDNARKALEDLRGVLGVLRAEEVDGTATPAGARPVEAPQPGLGSIAALVTESGPGVALVDDTRGEPPDTIGRTAYRIVQEGLTNARKHAPGAPATVRLSGDAGSALGVEVRTPPGTGRAPALPSGGLGLVGLRERAGLVGGTLEHGRDADGTFVLRAELPWPVEEGRTR